jgi:hypothetical protein
MEKEINIRSGLWLFFAAALLCIGVGYFGYRISMQSSYDTSFSYKFGTALSAITTIYLLLIFMPLPIEQHWKDKLRMGAVLTLGAAVIGIFCWPLASPNAKPEALTFFCSCVSVTDALIILLAAFVTGAAAYFIGYPNGRYTAVAAVPVGLGIWALRSGTMSTLLAYNNEIEQHRLIYMSLRWEGVFWFIVVAAGYAGVKAASRLCGDNADSRLTAQKKQQTADIALPLVVTSAIAWPLVNIFAQSPKIPTTDLGIIYSQPHQAQIAFALLAGFGVAGFLVRKFMKVRIEIPAISTVLFSLAAAIYCGRDSILAVSENMPAAFFKYPICAILPIQIIAFGTLGVLIGYAIAVLGHHKKLLLEDEQAVKE